jgi:hypothetical protein
MTTTLTADNAAGSTSPAMIVGYDAIRSSRNIIHDLIGGNIAVTLSAPRLRSGTLVFLYLTHTDAFTALELHAELTTFTLTCDTRTEFNMTYVIDGSVEISRDQETGRWLLSVTFQEVAP